MFSALVKTFVSFVLILVLGGCGGGSTETPLSSSASSSAASSASSSVASSSSSVASSTASSITNSSSSSSSVAVTYTVTAEVTGNSSGLILQNNGTDARNVALGGGSATFTAQANGSVYNITTNSPTGQICSVSNNGSGTISGANVNVSVTCSALKLRVTVNGLGDGKSVRLSKTIGNNAPSGAAVSFNPPSNMPAEITGAGNYGWSFTLAGSQKVSALGLYNIDFNSDVQVGLWNSSGSLLASGVFSDSLASLDLTDVGTSGFMWLPISEITLGPGLYTVGAYSSTDHFASYNVSINPITGLTITKYSLVSFSSIFELPADDSVSGSYLNGFFGPNIKFSGVVETSELLNITSSGTIDFPTPVSIGDVYAVTVDIQPIGQTCLFLSPVSGVISGTNNTILVSCSTNTYTIGGTISGLGNALSVVLLNNGGNALSITADGSFTFSSPMAAGSYSISIGTQPQGQACVITNGTGTVATTNIDNISVTCSNSTSCSNASNASTPSGDPFWTIYSDPTASGVDTTPLITSELPNLFQNCLSGTN